MSILNVNTIQPVGSGQTITVSATNISAPSTVVTASSFVGNVTATTISGVSTAGITTAYIGSINDGPISGARNRIINGDMRIDQRNAGASVTPSTTSSFVYTVDRWWYYATQASKFSIQQNAGSVTPPVGFTSYLGLTVASAVTPGASDQFLFGQSIEGFNFSDVGFGTSAAKSISVSFWVRSSLTGQFSVALENDAGTRSYAATYTITDANTWQYVTLTIPGVTSGTWGTGNGLGTYVVFDLGVGSNRQTTANTWFSGSADAASGNVKLVQTAGATFYITGVQLEPGTVATPFERRSYGQELALCQRYYAKSYKQSVVPGANDGDGCSVFYSHTSGTYTINGNIIFPVEMRAEPTVSIWSNSGTSGQFTASDSIAKSGSAGAVSQRQASMNVTSGNNNVTYRCQWVAAIEL